MKPWLTFLGDIIRASLKKKFFVQCCYPGTTGKQKIIRYSCWIPWQKARFLKIKEFCQATNTVYMVEFFGNKHYSYLK